ncbi:MAG TPA: sigma-70 family RNA polymerase sigma factor [Anaerolineae bacterium]|nr:sigma-70 family RNA polymerase sigma factor [Anaerolineae bacterium]
MTANADLLGLSVVGLSRRCAQETTAFFQRQPYDPAFCYELFRRALLERNQRAYECLYSQYQPLVAGWVEHHPGFPGAGEEVQYFVNRAFEKLWHALTPEKFSRFADLKALLSYLKLCAHSVVIDHARARQHLLLLDEEPSDAVLGGYAARGDVAEETIEQTQQQEFWRLINQRLVDEKEQAVVVGSFVLAMKPAELQVRYPHLFSDVREVYRTKQNVLDRLRRDPELRALRADYV